MNEKVQEVRKALNVKALKTFGNTLIPREILRRPLAGSALGAGAVRLLLTQQRYSYTLPLKLRGLEVGA